MSGQERKTLSQCIIFALFLHSCCGGQDDNYKVMRRDEKLLNVFNIVKFPNDGCTTAAGTYGVCYTASECLSLSMKIESSSLHFILKSSHHQVAPVLEHVRVVLVFAALLLEDVVELPPSTTPISKYSSLSEMVFTEFSF